MRRRGRLFLKRQHMWMRYPGKCRDNLLGIRPLYRIHDINNHHRQTDTQKRVPTYRVIMCQDGLPLFVLLIAACSSLPAQPPPQLQHTPGPVLVVQERTLQTPSYWADPPAGGRIVKSAIASD